jgi:hypothetical protein
VIIIRHANDRSSQKKKIFFFYKRYRGDFIVQSLFFIENHQFTFAGRLATRRKKGKKTLEGKEDRKLSSAIHGHVFSFQ